MKNALSMPISCQINAATMQQQEIQMPNQQGEPYAPLTVHMAFLLMINPQQISQYLRPFRRSNYVFLKPLSHFVKHMQN